MSTELSELFDRDPNHHSDQDIALIVKKMRENRAQFELGLRSPVGERKKAVTGKKTAADLLKDLGL